MGGASNVASRMRASTSAGAGLFNFLQGVRDSSDTGVRDWVNQLTSKNLSAYEVADEIIDQVISSGGSLEEESCRDSMAQAMSDLLTIDPDINLLNMDNDSIWTVMELFMANEAFNRINLDIGQLFESAKYSPREAVSRMNEMRDYLKSEISAQIQELRTDTSNPTKAEDEQAASNCHKDHFRGVRGGSMRKIVCSPENLIPQQLEEDTKYFSIYSNPRRENVGYFGSTLIKDIQRVGLRPSETVWDFNTIALAVAAADNTLTRKTVQMGGLGK